MLPALPPNCIVWNERPMVEQADILRNWAMPGELYPKIGSGWPCPLR